jgi:hypothetical protein
MLCRSLFVLLIFFVWPLCCLSFFDLPILITHLVSSNSSWKTYDWTCSKNHESIQYIDVIFLISILLSWLTNGLSTSVRLGGPLVEQDICTLSVHLMHLRLIVFVPVAKSLDFCVVLCISCLCFCHWCFQTSHSYRCLVMLKQLELKFHTNTILLQYIQN